MKFVLPAALVVIAVALLSSTAEAQTGQVPSCAAKLVPCASYLNSTKPPEDCCKPMRDAVKNELPCLCSLFNSPDLIKTFQINVTQALELPKHCGITSDTSICSKSGAAPPASSKSPPAAGGESSGKGGSDSSPGTFSRSTFIGIPGLVSLFFFAWSIIAV